MTLSPVSNTEPDPHETAAVKLVTKASQWRKIATRGRRGKGRGAYDIPAQYILRSRFTAAEFRALHCNICSDSIPLSLPFPLPPLSRPLYFST
ncbi:hypothetical protein EVAR_6893_1 [Eumeta japonica]|uniref:Uncharacterized protein n=1 Tax=Eumeta variegata TaxID=151549 RepID=A0A4C1TGC0_EUMVA|nr:hypothetical protein EVAR_6893_1 [Eumeta japonica]